MRTHPPLRDIPTVSRSDVNTDLIGRDHEIARIAALLIEGSARLIVITGTAGVGKTATAREVVRQVAPHFAGGSLVVMLEDVTDPELIVPTIAQQLGLSTSGTGDDVIRRLADRLNVGPFLLCLDNYEHLVGSTHAITELLQLCPRLSVLVTSRIALRALGAPPIEIEPLPVPKDVDRQSAPELAANPAVALFLRRAGAAANLNNASEAQLAEICQLCQRLDGLPLAIELAAAQVGAYSPVELLAMLDEPFALLVHTDPVHHERSRSLEGAIAWSYDLLDDAHRHLFRRLSMFNGGFTVHAAQAIAVGWSPADGYPRAGSWPIDPQPWWSDMGQDPPVADGSWTPPALPPLNGNVPTMLQSLVRQHLLRELPGAGGEPRFAFLQTIRAFGRARLAETNESDAVQHCHAVYYVAFAEACGLGLWRTSHQQWAERLAYDINNVRATLEWLSTQPGSANQLSLQAAETLWPYWQAQGSPGEGRRWLIDALSRDGGAPHARANAMNLAGLLAWYQNDNDAAAEHLRQGLELCNAIGWGVGTGRNLFFHALVAWRRGDLNGMKTLGEAALSALAGWDDYADAGMIKILLGIVARERHDLPTAMTSLQEAIAMFDVLEFPWGNAAARFYAGEIARDQGNLTQTAIYLRDALQRFREQSDLWGMGGCIASFALLVKDRQPKVAAQLLGASKAMTASVGSFLPPTENQRYAIAAQELAAHLGPTQFGEAFATGMMIDPARAVATALSIADEFAPITPEDRAALSPEYGQRMLRKLTPSQREVLWLLVDGLSRKEIQLRIGKSYTAVSDRLKRTQKEFGVTSDGALVAKIRDLGLKRPG